jgi:hypothetical protein
MTELSEREKRKQWATGEVRAEMWWCMDEECDCTQPIIVRITPNTQVGYPWVRRELLWEGEFLSATYEYTANQREELQYAPLRAACAERGLPVPDEAVAAHTEEQG